MAEGEASASTRTSGWSTALLVGASVAAADAGLAVVTGFRVPPSLVTVIFLGDVLAALVLALLILPVLRVLRRERALPRVLWFGLLLWCAVDSLQHFGLHVRDLDSLRGRLLIGALLVAGIVLGVVLLSQRPARRFPLNGLTVTAATVLALGWPMALSWSGLPVPAKGTPFAMVAVSFVLAWPMGHRGQVPGASVTLASAAALLAALSWIYFDARPALPTTEGSGAGAGDGAAARRPNLLLISVDTLRDDHVGPQDGEPSLTPELDRWFADGRRYGCAVSPAAWTLPAHASVMTGRHPAEHGALLGHLRIDPGLPMLAEQLHDAGYQTAAMTGGGYVGRRFGFDRGFDVFDQDSAWRYYYFHYPAAVHLLEQLPWRSTREFFSIDSGFHGVVDRAVEWLGEDRGQPFFLFLHTYEVHNYAQMYPWWEDDLRAEGIDAATSDYLDEQGLRSVNQYAERAYPLFHRVYRAGIRFTDRQLGRLFRALDEAGLSENTAVVVMSDHGEGFDLERNRISHGGRFHEDLIRVPLLVHLPRGVEFPEEAPLVSLLDIAPTLRELAGLDAGDTPGHSLLRAPAGAPRMGQEAYVREPKRTVGNRKLFEPEEWLLYLRTPDRKYIRTPYGWEVYDLNGDAAERHNLAARPEDVEERVRRLMESFTHGASEGSGVEGNAAEDELLRALGYVDH